MVFLKVEMQLYNLLQESPAVADKPVRRLQKVRTHGLRKSSGVVSCIARLPIDSLPMVSYYPS